MRENTDRARGGLEEIDGEEEKGEGREKMSFEI